jgi:TRAP-type C4-dicarboxylate transport system substrate-binding protein
MFRDMPHAWKVFHSPLVQDLSAKLLANKGIRIIAPFYYFGKRNLTANKPVRTPDDLKGMKIRVPNVRIQQEGIAAMGGQAAPLAYGEVYLALKQGLMDGQENPLSAILASKFYEVQKYLMLTEHIITNFMMGMSEQSFKKLNREQQIILLEAGMEAEAYNNYLVRKAEETSLAELQKLGMTVIIPEKDSFIKATESVREKHSTKFSEVYRRIQEMR